MVLSLHCAHKVSFRSFLVGISRDEWRWALGGTGFAFLLSYLCKGQSKKQITAGWERHYFPKYKEQRAADLDKKIYQLVIFFLLKN